MSEQAQATEARLNALLEMAGQGELDAGQSGRFAAYFSLILRWNLRINLSAIRDEEGILGRHFVESIACARALPAGIGTLLDFGSGAGLPGIPIAICRAEIAVTLAESQGKKAAFLNEAIRELGIAAKVFGGRAETLTTEFDCVTLRAVDRMERAVEAGAKRVRLGGWLAMMTTGSDLERLQATGGGGFVWRESVALPGGEDRVLALGQRAG